jgi:hypothetical protein
MPLKKSLLPAIDLPAHPSPAGANQMPPKALISALVLTFSLSASQALALTPEELAKAQELGSQLNPPVDIAELLADAEKYGVPCDPTSKLRIRICGQKIEIEALKASTEASRVRTEALKEDTEKTRQENAELIRELQRIIEEKNQ